MLISPAYAQAAGSTGGTSGLEAMLPLVLIFVVFYFLLIRPQQKKMKAQKALIASVKRGDKIVTGGGIIGTVTKVTENESEIQVEISPDVKVKVQRELISTVLSKTGPGEKTSKPASDDGKSNSNEGILSKFFGSKKQ